MLLQPPGSLINTSGDVLDKVITDYLILLGIFLGRR